MLELIIFKYALGFSRKKEMKKHVKLERLNFYNNETKLLQPKIKYSLKHIENTSRHSNRILIGQHYHIERRMNDAFEEALNEEAKTSILIVTLLARNLHGPIVDGERNGTMRVHDSYYHRFFFLSFLHSLLLLSFH